MTTSTTEEHETTQATATGEPPKATKRRGVGARARNVAPVKAKSGKKASPQKKAPKSAKRLVPAVAARPPKSSTC